MPSDATTILRIDPIKNVATTFGTVSSSINKWQGGVLSKVDKCVYAVPADMDCVLRIDTDPDTPLRIDLVGEGFQDIDDKWQGGFVGSDDKIYAIPVSNHVSLFPSLCFSFLQGDLPPYLIHDIYQVMNFVVVCFFVLGKHK